MLHSGCKVESVYVPPIKQPRRRWKWNKCLPLVVLALAGWVAVAWWAGTIWGR